MYIRWLISCEPSELFSAIEIPRRRRVVPPCLRLHDWGTPTTEGTKTAKTQVKTWSLLLSLWKRARETSAADGPHQRVCGTFAFTMWEFCVRPKLFSRLIYHASDIIKKLYSLHLCNGSQLHGAIWWGNEWVHTTAEIPPVVYVLFATWVSTFPIHK